MQSEAAVLEFPPPAGSADIKALFERSDRKGLERLLIHVCLLGATGSGVYFATGWLLPLAMILHGIVLAALFAPFHEGVHYTPFKSRRLNEVVAWISGVAIIWNSTWYRCSHAHHHRYCQDAARDPELLVAKPTTRLGYLVRISAIPFYRALILTMMRIALGRFAGTYVAESAQRRVRRSVLAQFGVYGLAIVASIATGWPAILIYWFIPLFLGQPFVRGMLFAEHTGCDFSSNNYENTRTTLASWPVNLLMWNMPYHALHHSNPGLPFHAMPAAHALLAPRVKHISPGYWAFTKAYLRNPMMAAR